MDKRNIILAISVILVIMVVSALFILPLSARNTIELTLLIPKDKSVNDAIIKFSKSDHIWRSDSQVKYFNLIINSIEPDESFHDNRLDLDRIKNKNSINTISNDSILFYAEALPSPDGKVYKKGIVGYLKIDNNIIFLCNIIGNRFPLDKYFDVTSYKKRFEIDEKSDKNFSGVRTFGDNVWSFCFFDGKLIY